MRNMNLDVKAETKEEKEIESYLTLLHSSIEVKSFIDEMELYAKEHNIFKYRARIKDIKSAIRTYRINNKKLVEAHDYLGISFLTNNETEIYSLIECLKERLSSDIELIDFVSEKMIYSPLVYIKWVPPLGYNIFAHEELIQGKMKVPIEIRVCSKEGYISEQSAYYSVQKNDSIKMPIEDKNKLRNIVQHITYKLAIIANRNLAKADMNIQIKELQEILNLNKIFLISNWNLVEEAIIDCGMLIYKIQRDDLISADESNLSKEDILKIEDEIKKVFWNNFHKTQKENYFEMTTDGNYKANLGKMFFECSKFMQSISYENIKLEAIKEY